MKAKGPNQAAGWTRRRFLEATGLGLGSLALPSSLARASALDPETNLATLPPLPPGQPHFAPRAKRVIFLFMIGGPSQLDLFDPKPLLIERNGQPLPDDVLSGDDRFAFIEGRPKLIGSPYRFARHGESGAEVSELLPHLATVADDLAIVRSAQSSLFNHGPAQVLMTSGHRVPGRPSLGSWLSYALGTENPNLPAFSVLLSGEGRPSGGSACWGSGFLPTQHQGVEIRTVGGGIPFLHSPAGMDRAARGRQLQLVNELNAIRLAGVGDAEIRTRMEAYDLAYRMQESLPELMDLRGEERAIADYGATPGETSFANNCLLARRLVERGARFVQLFHFGWDHHGELPETDLVHGLGARCREVDQPAAALVRDLKQRGLLDDTLVVWTGEFGRTPMNEERGGSKLPGRDHHPRAFTLWMAGGGVRPGITVGRTDDFGYDVVEDPFHVHDLNATILHLMGLDHTRLAYEHMGRNFRLTDVYGQVLEKLLA